MNRPNFAAKHAVGAIRVSTVKQGTDGDSPEAQREQIERFAANKGFVIKKFFVFLESASKEQQPMQEAVDYCKDPKNGIGYFIIKSIDRFTRGGSLSYDLLKTQLEKSKVNLVDIYGIIGANRVNTLEHLGVEYRWSTYSPSKKSEILEAERSKDEFRDIMTRIIGAEVRYTRLGYWMRKPPYGYVSRRVETNHGKRTVLEAHPTEAEHIRKMFELRATGEYTDNEIARKLNDMGYRGHIKRSLKLSRLQGVSDEQRTKLTGKQLWRMVRHPIYAGIICEQWTDDKPIKCAFEGLVSIDLFNQANKGRKIITEHNNGKITLAEFKESRYTNKGKRSGEFPYKKFIMCPDCKKPLYASATRGRSGKYYPAYYCNRKGHSFRVNKQELEDKVDAFIGKLQLSPEHTDEYLEVMEQSWQSLNSQYDNQVGNLDKRILSLQNELNATVQKIKILESVTAIKCLEEELVRLEKAISYAVAEKQALVNKKPLDLKDFGRKLKHLYEHFGEVARQQIDPVKKARLFSLLFDQPPTYADLDLGTAQKSAFLGVNSLFLPQNIALSSAGTPGGIRTPDRRDRSPLL